MRMFQINTSCDTTNYNSTSLDEKINEAAKCYTQITTASKTAGYDRTDVPMPVCSGISGLGKTRMLEEGSNILRHVLKLNPNDIASVIVPYYNGFSPQLVEKSMPIQGSFSWRLLYRVFLDNKCSLPFTMWLTDRLPSNGGQLTLGHALQVVVRKMRGKREGPSTPLYLFLGIDKYQAIEALSEPVKITTLPCEPGENKSALHGLMDAIGNLLCSPLPNLVVLPMFAGTDFDVIASIARSSYFVTTRLPMTLLTLEQVFSFVESNPTFAPFLGQAPIRHDLFILGGVPRWVVDYLLQLRAHLKPGEGGAVTLDNIKASFMSIRRAYLNSYWRYLDVQQWIRLAAFAVSGLRVSPNHWFDQSMKWSRLRDSSLCLLIECESINMFDIRVPYALLSAVGSLDLTFMTYAERSFVEALKDMTDHVDTQLLEVQPWELWEIFGACFYAVRINALLVLGYSKGTLGELLPGVMMTDATRAISVNLFPSQVSRSAEKFGSETTQFIPQHGNESVTRDWISGGLIVLSGGDGGGVDIVFALKDAVTDTLIVFVDQRRRQYGTVEPSHAKTYLDKALPCPDFLVKTGARVVRGVVNCVAASNLAEYTVPPDCFILTRERSEQFYGVLAYHPSCSPFVSINSGLKTALRSVLTGRGKILSKWLRESRGSGRSRLEDSSHPMSCAITSKNGAWKLNWMSSLRSFQFSGSVRKHPQILRKWLS